MDERADGDNPRFTASHIVEYDYRRSVGATLGRFFTDLRDREITGSRTPSGRVMVPPTEFDPATGECTSSGLLES